MRGFTLIKYILAYLSIGLFCSAYAQETMVVVTGNVRTADNKPAEFINISLKNTYYSTVTNATGEFSFEAAPGNYTMVVSSISAHSSEFAVKIKADSENHFRDITIIERSMELGNVVVTGQFSPQSLNRSVYRVRAISAKQIEQKAPSSLESLLNTETGIRISNDMALGESDFEVMGMSGNNVKVLINGIPVVDRFSKKQSLSQIDVNSIERIEIVEGPMSVTYGTDALAGVINIITKKTKVNNSLSVGARVHEETMGSEYDPLYYKGIHIQSINIQSGIKNDMFAGANFTHNEFGGWRGNAQGRQKEWPAKEQFMGGGQFGITKTNYDFIYQLDYLNENILIKGNVPENLKATDTEFTANRYTHMLQGNWKTNHRLKMSLSASYQNYARDKHSRVINFGTGEKYTLSGENNEDNSSYSILFARGTAVWRALTNLNLQGGIEFQNNKGKGDKINPLHTSIDNAAAFVSAEYSPLQWLDLRPGVRLSYNSIYKDNPVIPSMNVKLGLNEKMDLRMSYGRGFRAPTLQELYYTFYHVNNGGFWIKGNPDLKAEKSDSYMASWVWRPLHGGQVRLTTTLSGFFNNFKDRIQMVSSLNDPTMQTYYNTGKYQTLGASFENTFACKDLKATVNFSYIGRYNALFSEDKYKDRDQKKFRYSPEVSSSLTYTWDRLASFNLFYKFTGARQEYREIGNKLVLAGLNSYHWADFTVSRPIFKYLNINAGIKNIFDVTRVDNNITGQSASMSPSLIGCGRSYFMGLTFKFN